MWNCWVPMNAYNYTSERSGNAGIAVRIYSSRIWINEYGSKVNGVCIARIIHTPIIHIGTYTLVGYNEVTNSSISLDFFQRSSIGIVDPPHR